VNPDWQAQSTTGWQLNRIRVRCPVLHEDLSLLMLTVPAVLQDYWLHHPLPETRWEPINQSQGGMELIEDQCPVWEMGNRLLNYTDDVHFRWPQMRGAINYTEGWQYIQHNAERECDCCCTSP
jgi:hypothetical protein